MREIFNMEFGSHVYGTNLPTSDRDYKGVFIPCARNIILARARDTITTTTKGPDKVKNTAEDTDTELFSLKQYMKLLLEGQTVALTMLFCPPKHCLKSTVISREIVKYKDKWLHKGVSAFAGYCRQQANKYGIKGSRVAAARLAVDFFELSYWTPHTKLKDIWPQMLAWFTDEEHCEFITDVMRGNSEYPVRMLSVCNRKVQEHITVKEARKIYKHLFDEYGQRALQAEKNEGVDWKALMHAVRVSGEAVELLSSEHITYPRPNADILLKIRKGELPYPQVAEMIEEGLAYLEVAQKESMLPEHPDYQFAEDFVFNTYLEEIDLSYLA